MSSDYFISKCRDPHNLPSGSGEWAMSPELVRNLVDDEYWADNGRARDAAALVPKPLAHHIRQCFKAGKEPLVPSNVAGLFRGSWVRESDSRR